jgi:hypothetical protein
MPNLASHQSATTTKLLLIGDPGSGKTGALASLASAGYQLRILDFDNGLDVLKNLLSDPKTPYDKKAINNVTYMTVTDEMKNVAGKLIPSKATAWSQGIQMLQHWKEPTVDGVPGLDLGPVTSWGPKDILVIDSLTFLCRAAMQFILSLNGRLGQQAHQSDWFHAQQLIEGLLETFKSKQIGCNVIMLCHITYIGEEGQQNKGYPNSLGKALSPKIGSYFNNTLMVQTTGQGANQKRRIKTNTTGIIELKNSAPLSVLPEYDITDGLALYFKAVRGEDPK